MKVHSKLFSYNKLSSLNILPVYVLWIYSDLISEFIFSLLLSLLYFCLLFCFVKMSIVADYFFLSFFFSLLPLIPVNFTLLLWLCFYFLYNDMPAIFPVSYFQSSYNEQITLRALCISLKTLNKFFMSFWFFRLKKKMKKNYSTIKE